MFRQAGYLKGGDRIIESGRVIKLDEEGGAAVVNDQFVDLAGAYEDTGEKYAHRTVVNDRLVMA